MAIERVHTKNTILLPSYRNQSFESLSGILVHRVDNGELERKSWEVKQNGGQRGIRTLVTFL